MRSDPVTLLSAGNMATTLTSKGVYLDQIYAFSMQCIYTGGTPAGTISVQGSNDNVQVNPVTGQDPAANVVNWTTLTLPASATTSTAGSVILDSSGTGVRWLRAKYVPSGTDSAGSLTVIYNGKG